MTLPVVVLTGASLVRITIAYANRSVLLGLKERESIAKPDLSWNERTIRLPYAILYPGLGGIATLIGAIALAIGFRLVQSRSCIRGITYATPGVLAVLFFLYGVALAIIGYIAAPAVLSLDRWPPAAVPSLTQFNHLLASPRFRRRRTRRRARPLATSQGVQSHDQPESGGGKGRAGSTAG